MVEGYPPGEGGGYPSEGEGMQGGSDDDADSSTGSALGASESGGIGHGLIKARGGRQIHRISSSSRRSRVSIASDLFPVAEEAGLQVMKTQRLFITRCFRVYFMAAGYFFVHCGTCAFFALLLLQFSVW